MISTYAEFADLLFPLICLLLCTCSFYFKIVQVVKFFFSHLTLELLYFSFNLMCLVWYNILHYSELFRPVLYNLYFIHDYCHSSLAASLKIISLLSLSLTPIKVLRIKQPRQTIALQFYIYFLVVNKNSYARNYKTTYTKLVSCKKAK